MSLLCIGPGKSWVLFRVACHSVATALLVFAVATPPASAIDLLNDNIQFSNATLNLRKYAQLPFNLSNVISMTTRANDPRLYFATQEGAVFVVNEDANGQTTTELFFDALSSIQVATGRTIFGSGGQDGLQSIAFHPDYDNPGTLGYGKFYTTMLETRPASVAGHHYLGNPNFGDSSRDSVVAEWTDDRSFGGVDEYREVFRARLPVADHMIKQARFNPYARPGDEDYGLLYISHGDSSSQESFEDRPQHFDNIVGKILRIDPLRTESSPYSIPASNPFANSSDPNVLKEIYAYGFRNPHTFSFNPDQQGQVRLIAGDIGRANIEEINIIENGGNYGWPKREGTFVHTQDSNGGPNSGYYSGVTPLTANEAELGPYIYPVAQFDHNNNFDTTPINQTYVSVAVASSFVINNGSDPQLQNQLIFTNFAGSNGNVYLADFDEMLGAKTKLESGDAVAELTQAEVQRLFLTMDGNYYSELTHLLNTGRSDARFGQGVFGEMYISNKHDGFIYLVTNSVPLRGDYNRDHVVDAADYTVWRDSLGQVGYQLNADGDGNGKVDASDLGVWKAHFGETWDGSGYGLGASQESRAPEPTTGVLFCMFAACHLVVARRSGRQGNRTQS